MKEFWDERYGQEEYIYGEEPNAYLKDKLKDIPTGKILFPAEGEGRNSVYAAGLGWESYAFDQSEEGKNKALLLAKKKGVEVDYKIANLDTIEYPEEYFDALSLIYAHFPLANRREYHKKLSKFIRAKGLLIIEGFSKEHAEYQKENPTAGGPKNIDMLYDLNELLDDFPGFEVIEAIEEEIFLEEGAHHLGKASVIRVKALKK